MSSTRSQITLYTVPYHHHTTVLYSAVVVFLYFTLRVYIVRLLPIYVPFDSIPFILFWYKAKCTSRLGLVRFLLYLFLCTDRILQYCHDGMIVFDLFLCFC